MRLIESPSRNGRLDQKRLQRINEIIESIVFGRFFKVVLK